MKCKAGQTWSDDGDEYVIIGRSRKYPDAWVIEEKKLGYLHCYSERVMRQDKFICNADDGSVKKGK